MKFVTFFRKNGDPANRVVDFLWERDTFRNKIMEIVQDFDEKSCNNNGKTLEIVEDFACESIFFHFSFLFHHFSTFFFVFFFHFLWELRSLFRVIGLLHIIGLCSHTCVTCSSALCSTLVCAVFRLVELLGPPRASLAYQARVYCGCKPGPTRVLPMPRQYGIGRRAPALRTLDDDPRFQGDVDNKRVILHSSSTWSWLRFGQLRDHVTERSHPPLHS